MTSIRSLAAALAAVVLALLLTSCGGSGEDSGSLPDLAASEPGGADAAGLQDEMTAKDMAAEPAAGEDGDAAAEPAAATGPAIISTGVVALADEDVAGVRLEVRKVVDTYQGTVTEQETTTGEGGEVTSARMVIRVPSASFSDATADLEDLATLTSSTSSGQDVSAEVVDVEARIRAQRQSVNRIEALLARADSIEQIVAIESQLASRQAELDALVARQAWLADQTSLSTITVYVEQPGESDEPEDRDGFLGGLAAGWDSFVDGLGAALTFVGFVLPWLALALLVGWPVWALLRRRGGRPSSEATAPAAAGPSGSA